MSWPPHITVATIVEQDGKFLIVEERVDGNIVFNQPAGHLEPGETLFEAAIRETREETGWEVRLTALTGIYHYHAPAVDITYHRLTFSATPQRQVSTDLDRDIVAAHWLTLAELEHRPLRSPLVTSTIRDYLSGQSIALGFITHL